MKRNMKEKKNPWVFDDPGSNVEMSCLRYLVKCQQMTFIS